MIVRGLGWTCSVGVSKGCRVASVGRQARAFSVGMIVGGALLATWGGLKNRAVMMVASTVVFGGLSVALGLSTNLWVFFDFMLLVGLAAPFFSTTSMTVLQETVEPEMQGRVFGFVGIVMAVAMPVGMVVFGPLADRFTVEAVLVASGVVTFLVVVAAVVLPSGRLAIDAVHRHAAT